MNDFFLTLLLLGSLSSGGPMPFWATANRYGLMPEASGATAVLRAGSPSLTRDWQFEWGTTAALNLDTYLPAGMSGGASSRLLVDELYAGLRWKRLSLDVGAKRPERFFYGSWMPDLGPLSVTGGRMAWSGNARSVPGYTLTLAPMPVPHTLDRVWLFGSFGDYRTLDQRYTSDALLHAMQMGVMVRFQHVDVTAGLDHYALWGGAHPENGRMPLSLENYFRMALGMHAASGSRNDVINVIGDQRGSEFLRIRYNLSVGWVLTAQHDIPYDDSSGMRFQNFPDGVNTLHLTRRFNDSEWVSDILYEYHNTMWQSGTRHDRPTTDEEKQHLDPSDEYHYEHHVIGGGDNYFNNGEYRTAWTYYGRTIGNPLFFPQGTHAGTWDPLGETLGVENNRIRAHHFALAGHLFHRAPYRLMLTYSRNYGLYAAPYAGESQWDHDPGTVKETPLRQLSFGMDGEIPLQRERRWFTACPLNLVWGVYADRGSLLPDTWGATFGLRWRMQ
ncbi:MAG: hypothetical protein IJM60_04445 [Bacteroidales bacterium]|nr:hypothetical protein [Bacteroidales bacterium]